MENAYLYPYILCQYSVASLGWVTPGAATEGVTPPFFPEKPGDLFLLIALIITVAFYCFYSGVTPSRVSPHTPPVRPRFSTILCKFAHKKISFGCHPLEGVTRGGPRPPPLRSLVTPLIKHDVNCFHSVSVGSIRSVNNDRRTLRSYRTHYDDSTTTVGLSH